MIPLPSRRLFCVSRVLGNIRLLRFGTDVENVRDSIGVRLAEEG